MYELVWYYGDKDLKAGFISLLNDFWSLVTKTTYRYAHLFLQEQKTTYKRLLGQYVQNLFLLKILQLNMVTALRHHNMQNGLKNLLTSQILSYMTYFSLLFWEEQSADMQIPKTEKY